MATREFVLKPRRGWQPVHWREVWAHRELFGMLVWRDVKIRYKQTALGAAWAVLQPFLAMLIFTALLHHVNGIQSNGPPYALFAYAGLVPWLFFMNGVNLSSSSLVGNQQLVSKIYFPRLYIPLAPIMALFLDMLVALGLMAALMAWYRYPPSAYLVLLPAFILASYVAAAGPGLILSALNVRFRDVKYAVPFLLQMGMFATPVIYPLQTKKLMYRVILGLDPMTGVVDGFRYAIFGTHPDWFRDGLSLASAGVIFVIGLFMFRRMELQFTDVI